MAAVVDVSPDGSELLVLGEKELAGTVAGPAPMWIVPVLGGSMRPVGGLRAEDAAWAPDGTRLAYVVGAHLYVAGTDGSGVRPLADAPGPASRIAWAPDGRRVRFTVTDRRNERGSLWELALEDAAPHAVLPGFAASACCGRWTRDGTYYVFQAMGDRTWDLWALPERTFGRWLRPAPVRLTHGPLEFHDPVPSRDGREIYAVGRKLLGELVRYDPRSRDFVPFFSGLSAQGLDFSRDGKWVTYVRYPEGTLWRSRVDGSERLQLTFPPMQAGLPRWSPDAARIAFHGGAPGQPWRIHVVSAAGGAVQPLTSGERNELDATWSPDGRTLAYGRGFWEGDDGSPITIQLLDLESGRRTTLPGSEGLFSPRWSPDGRYLVALSHDSLRLLVLDLASAQWRELAAGRQVLAYPSWSRDTRHVYFNEGERRIRLTVADGEREVVATFAGLRQASGSVGQWVGQAPDESVLTLRDVSVQDLFALDWGPEHRDR